MLACAQGGSNLAVAARLGVNRNTVSKWRALSCAVGWIACRTSRARGAAHYHRAQVEEVLVRTLERGPRSATHWSKRELVR